MRINHEVLCFGAESGQRRPVPDQIKSKVKLSCESSSSHLNLASRFGYCALQLEARDREEHMSPATEGGEKSPLDAAQKIVAELAGMGSDHQVLALKFAIETLGLQLPNSYSPAPTPNHPPHFTPPPLSPSADHSTDIRAFTAAKAPKSDQQFAAVVAYFYQFEAKPEERRDLIDADTMKEAARLAGRAQVQRWNMTLTNAKNAGYLDGGGAGKFKLSSVGENLVAITLPGDGGHARVVRKSNGKKRPAAKTEAKSNKKKK